MAKGLEKRKESRKKNAEENKNLKLKKNWYPVSNLKSHFVRKCKIPKASHIAAPLTPGQVVIILSGRFRGRRVVYLKKLESNLLLVTGPYKYNGVPLKRVNAAYVLPTNTKLKLDGEIAKNLSFTFLATSAFIFNLVFVGKTYAAFTLFKGTPLYL